MLDNVWDLVILLDYLATRPDVDASKIGMTGLSLGGMHSWLTAALDDRVAVAAPMIGVQASIFSRYFLPVLTVHFRCALHPLESSTQQSAHDLSLRGWQILTSHLLAQRTTL